MWPLYIVIGVLFGAYLGFIQLLGLRFGLPIEPWKPFVWEYSSVLIIFALAPFIVRLESRFPLDAKPRAPIILTHLAAALVFSLIHVIVIVTLRKLVYTLAGQVYVFGNALLGFIYELQKDVIVYLVIVLLAFAVREFQVRRATQLRAINLAAELSEAHLRHLNAQVDPHFLFNALNAISNRMREDVDAADRMISHLGDLLRAAYDTNQQLLTTLDSELQWLRGYTAMMAERFRGQLTFELQIEPDLESLKVPRLLLQPIVENAFRHGLREGRGSVSVSVTRNENDLCCVVSDDGVGVPEEPLHRTGLSNVARRLELMFPGRHELRLASRLPRGTVVTLKFPVSE